MNGSDFLAMACGLCSALTWGAGDFSGGFATKNNRVLSVVFYSQIAGVVFLLALTRIFPEPVPDVFHLFLGALAGICGTTGIIFFYKALSMGKMGVVAPLSAVITALLPIFFTFVTEGLPSSMQLTGIVLAVVSVWLLSQTGEKADGISKTELQYTILSGLGFGLFFIIMDRASETAHIWPIVSARFTTLTLFFTILFLRKQTSAPKGRNILPIVLCGVLDAAGNTFFVLAANMGRLDIAAVLASFYPGATVLLAYFLLKERLIRLQWAGVFTSLAALILFGL